MSGAPTPDELPQLNCAAVERLAKDPGALNAAYAAGQFRELMAGREPGTCPSCGRSMSDA